MCDLADQRFSCLCREVKLLKDERVQQSELVATYRNQLNNRDREIDRLTRMLEGGRPISAVNKDCCCNELERRLTALSSDFQKLDKKNRHLEHQARDAVLKQHEAMNRAVKLADRNTTLEKELHDLNYFAHAVKSDCNSNAKETSKRASQIQLNLEGSLSHISDLEREVLTLKRQNQESQAEFEKLKNEKQNLQKMLESNVDEKKGMTDRINQFTVMEHDLNIEIDRLTGAVNAQKLRIAELESRILSLESQPSVVEVETAEKSPVELKKKKVVKKTVKSPKATAERPALAKRATSEKGKSRHETRVKEIPQPRRPLSRDNSDTESPVASDSDRPQDDRAELINRLQIERDFYYKECQRLQEQLTKVSTKEDAENAELRCRLQSTEQDLSEVEQMMQRVNAERTALQVRLDSCLEREAERSSPVQATSSLKAAQKRLERERDEARGDQQRLQEERDALRERLKVATETQVSEHARYEKALLECEERVRKLEAERRELINCQAPTRSKIDSLEEQLQRCKEKEAATEHELSQQRMLYSQIKTLHEQTDRALADTQGQLSRDESELNLSRERIRELERNRAALDREVAQLKNERANLKTSLAHVDQEKDALVIELDEKTERAAQLSQELNANESKMHSLQEKVNELQRKQGVILDENACKEKLLRNSEQEVQTLRQELGNLQRVHENTMREMRRLTDDLTTAAQDSRLARSELEQARQEVENLKRQLQDYVAEVQRVEELLQHKEGERGDLLDHFRSLSAEARSLESNNQSLNHEAEDTKLRLDQAEMRILDLEMVVETRNNLVLGYENQIADLSAHVASLEGRLQAETDQKSRLEADISAVRDLCVKLDSQKDNLIEATAESNLMKAQLENELARVQDELDSVHDDLAKDRGTVESLEQCLAASRQETTEGRAANQELQVEIAALHRRMDDLQNRLDSETSEVRRYQEQAADYSQQISELRREVTNEKFEKARITEGSRRSCEPGCSCLRTGVNRYAGASTPDPASLSRPRRQVGSSPACACPPPGQPRNVGQPRNMGQPVTAVRRPVDYQTIKSSSVPPDGSGPDARQTGSCRKDCKGIKDLHPMAASSRSASAKKEGLASFQKVKRGNSSSSSISSSESDVSSLKNRNIKKRAVNAEYPAATVHSHKQKTHDSVPSSSPKDSMHEKPSAVQNIAGNDLVQSKLPQSSKCRGSCYPNRVPRDDSKDLHRQKVTANLVPEASSCGNEDVDKDGSIQQRKRKSCRCGVEKHLQKLKPESVELVGIVDMENVGRINTVHQKVTRESDGTHNELQGRNAEHHEAHRELPRTSSEHLVASREHHGASREHHGASREHHEASREHQGARREHDGTGYGGSKQRKGARRDHHGTGREHHGRSTNHGHHQSPPKRNRMRNESDSDMRHKRSPFHCAARDQNSDNSKESVYRAKRANHSLEDHFYNESGNEHSLGPEKILSTVGPVSTINDDASSHASTVNDTSSSHASSVNDTASSVSFRSASSVNNEESHQPHNNSDVVETHKHNSPSYIN